VRNLVPNIKTSKQHSNKETQEMKPQTINAIMSLIPRRFHPVQRDWTLHSRVVTGNPRVARIWIHRTPKQIGNAWRIVVRDSAGKAVYGNWGNWEDVLAREEALLARLGE